MLAAHTKPSMTIRYPASSDNIHNKYKHVQTQTHNKTRHTARVLQIDQIEHTREIHTTTHHKHSSAYLLVSAQPELEQLLDVVEVRVGDGHLALLLGSLGRGG